MRHLHKFSEESLISLSSLSLTESRFTSLKELRTEIFSEDIIKISKACQRCGSSWVRGFASGSEVFEILDSEIRMSDETSGTKLLMIEISLENVSMLWFDIYYLTNKSFIIRSHKNYDEEEDYKHFILNNVQALIKSIEILSYQSLEIWSEEFPRLRRYLK